jgi:hypothetical protein
MGPHRIQEVPIELYESQILNLPELSDLVDVPEGNNDEDDDASLTFEDLMGMSDSTIGNNNSILDKESYHASCETIPEIESTVETLWNTSCPDLRPIKTQQKKRKKKKKKKQIEKRPTIPERSVSFSANVENLPAAEPLKSHVPPPRSKSFHSSFSSSHGYDLDWEEWRKRRGASTTAHPAEFGASCETISEIESSTVETLWNASCPTLRPIKTQQKKRKKKKKKKERKNRPTIPERSVSFSATVRNPPGAEPLKARVSPPRSKSFHSSFSSFYGYNLEGEEWRKRQGASTTAYPVEFGASFSSSAHVSGLRKKIESDEGRQQSFEETLDMVKMWKREQKREERHSVRSCRSIDCENKMDLTDKPRKFKTARKHQGTTTPRKEEKKDLEDYLADAFKRNLVRRLSLDNIENLVF